MVKRAVRWIGILGVVASGVYLAIVRPGRLRKVVLGIRRWIDREPTAPGDYSTARRERLLADFDRAERRVRWLIEARYGKDQTAALVRETRQEYERLIPEIPFIGGDRNPLTMNLTMSALLLAMYRVLKGRGKTVEEIGRLVYDISETWYRAYPGWLLRLLGRLRFTRFYLAGLRRRAAASQERRYPGDWVFSFVEGDGKDFDFGVDYTECGICKYFHDRDADEIVPYLCSLDYPLSEAFGLGLVRTKTLAQGDDRCDFRFKRGRETEFALPSGK